MNKIRLSENKLRNIIRESINTILSETIYEYGVYFNEIFEDVEDNMILYEIYIKNDLIGLSVDKGNNYISCFCINEMYNEEIIKHIDKHYNCNSVICNDITKFCDNLSKMIEDEEFIYLLIKKIKEICLYKNITINYFPFLRRNFYLKESIIKEYGYDSTNGRGGYDDIDRLGANAAYNVFVELRKLRGADQELDNYFIERIIDKFTDNLWALVEVGSEKYGGLGLSREKYRKDIENGLYNN